MKARVNNVNSGIRMSGLVVVVDCRRPPAADGGGGHQMCTKGGAIFLQQYTTRETRGKQDCREGGEENTSRKNAARRNTLVFAGKCKPGARCRSSDSGTTDLEGIPSSFTSCSRSLLYRRTTEVTEEIVVVDGVLLCLVVLLAADWECNLPALTKCSRRRPLGPRTERGWRTKNSEWSKKERCENGGFRVVVAWCDWFPTCRGVPQLETRKSGGKGLFKP